MQANNGSIKDVTVTGNVLFSVPGMQASLEINLFPATCTTSPSHELLLSPNLIVKALSKECTPRLLVNVSGLCCRLYYYYIDGEYRWSGLGDEG
jgi:hypothetical protein